MRGVLYRAFPFLRSALLREQWTKGQLQKIPAGETILDVGAGKCPYREYCNHLQYTSQDFRQYDGQGDGKGMPTGEWDTSHIDVVCDACALPAEDGAFQNVLCTEVLEHLPYPDRAIREIARVLKSHGRLILTAPFWSLTHLAPFHYCTGFSPYWYQRVLPDHGFEILEIERSGNYFTAILQELIRVPFVLKEYSNIGVVAYVSFLCILPTVFVIYLLSFLTKKSDEQLCHSMCVLARRMP